MAHLGTKVSSVCRGHQASMERQGTRVSLEKMAYQASPEKEENLDCLDHLGNRDQ